MTNPVIRRAFEAPLNDIGFAKKSDSWYLNSDDAILIANLQRSQYGEQYYINLAVWMKFLGDQRYPKENLCHIRIRLTSIAPQNLEIALNGEDRSMSDMERQATIDRAMRNNGIPFLLECSSVEKVRNMVLGNKFAKAFVHPDVKKLGTSPEEEKGAQLGS